MSRKTKSKRFEAPITGAEALAVESGAFESSGSQDSSIPWWRKVANEPAALLLSIIVLLRPWRDGVTFPYQNAYFVWAIVVAVTIWAIGALRRGDVIRCIRPVLLLTGFLLVSALVGFNSIQYDGTYRNLIWWAGHLGVFILATNALRSRLAVGMVLGAFATASFLEAVFGILHLQYILPFTRLLVNLDSRVLSGAGVDSLSPQLANRLESNRAFGTFLFPNALAAYMILGIPYAIGAAIRNFHRLRLALAAAPTRLEAGQLQERRLISAGAGLVAWLAAFVAGCLLMYLVLSPYKYYHLQTISGRSFPVSDPASAHLFVWVWWMAIAPLIPAVVVWFVTLRRGWTVSWPALCLVGVVALGVSEIIALKLTISRGGAIALLLALFYGALLLVLAHLLRSGGKRKPKTPSGRKVGGTLAALAVFPLVAVAVHLGAPAHAESTARTDTPNSQSLIDIEGTQHHISETFDPTSARLRIGYWKTGLLMVKDNSFTGVGMGNFGVAYPKYQTLGVSDTKMAHNDYLQVLCETGLFGFLLFAGFWAYFVVWGARRVVTETDRAERWTLAGLYAGVLAFLAHSAIDFNFQNTSLALNVFVLAGIFYARTAPAPPAPKQRWRHQLAALLILAVAWIVFGAQVRVRAVDNVIDNSSRMYDMPAAIADLLRRTDPAVFDPGKPPRFNLPGVTELISNRVEQESFGKILIVLSNGSSRYLEPGEPEPQDLVTIPQLEIRDPNTARTKVYQGIDAWVARLEAIDASYPHSPLMGAYICRWCTLVLDNNHDPAVRKRWILKGLEWAEELVRRSPGEYWLRSYLGRALFLRAGIEPNSQLAVETLQRGIDQFREASVLYPTSAEMANQYGDALEKAGAAFKRAGDSVRGDAMIADGQKAKAKAKEIKEYKERTHTGATG